MEMKVLRFILWFTIWTISSCDDVDKNITTVATCNSTDNWNTNLKPVLQVIEKSDNLNSPLCNAVQEGIIRSFYARYEMILQCQFVLDILNNRPDQNSTKEYWNVIDTEITRILQTALLVMQEGFKFENRFFLLYSTANDFLEAIKEGQQFEVALYPFEMEVEQFKDFSLNFSANLNAIRSGVNDGLKEMVRNFKGAENFKQHVAEQKKLEAKYFAALNDYNKKVEIENKNILDVQNELIYVKSQKEYIGTMLEYAKSQASMSKKSHEEMEKNANEKIIAIEKQLETAQDYRTQYLGTKHTYGFWYLWSKQEDIYGPVYTGEKKKFEESLNNWKKEQMEAKNKHKDASEQAAKLGSQNIRLLEKEASLQSQIDQFWATIENETKTLEKVKLELDQHSANIENFVKDIGIPAPYVEEFLIKVARLLPYTMQASIESLAFSESVNLISRLIETSVYNYANIGAYLQLTSPHKGTLISALDSVGYSRIENLDMTPDEYQGLETQLLAYNLLPAQKRELKDLILKRKWEKNFEKNKQTEINTLTKKLSLLTDFSQKMGNSLKQIKPLLPSLSGTNENLIKV